MRLYKKLFCLPLHPTEDLEKYATKLRNLANKITDVEMLNENIRLLKSLANETRLKMMKVLSKKEMCVCAIAIALDLTQPTASHHLNILENVKLVKSMKKGKWVFYSVSRSNRFRNLFNFLEIPD
jgi:ArsR family transcriptional regulator